MVSECTNSGCDTRQEGSTVTTRIIPDMMFTCTGTVVKWRAAGIYDVRSVNAMLDIWRERSGVAGTYDKVATIELGTCGSGVEATLVTGLSDVYECTLPESLRVSVQPGDIVGIEIARSTVYNFRLYFDDTNSGSTNYVFNGQFSTVTLSQRDSTSQDQPQISLTVEMAVQTTESSTTTQLPTTITIASTTELTTAADTTPGEAQTTTIVMEYTTPLTVDMAVQTTESSTTTQLPTTTIASTTELTTAADTTPGEVEMAVQTTDSSTTAQLSIASTTELTTAADNTHNSEIVTTTGAVSGVTTTSDAVSDQPISSGTNVGLVVGIVVIALIAVTLTVTVIVLVIILRGNKRHSLSTSVPTDTNQAYGVTIQRDMDEICNEEDVYSYPEVVLDNEVKTRPNEAYATTISTEGNVAYYSTNMFVQENEACVTNVTNEAPIARNVIVSENHHVYESESEHEYY